MTVILTGRLRLRPPEPRDAPLMALYAGDHDVARMTSRIPSPYPLAAARQWIDGRAASSELAFTAEAEGRLVGVCSLIGARGPAATPGVTPATPAIGYWVGRPFWGRGYASELARALVRHAFLCLGAEAMRADHCYDNPASRQVILKCGFRLTGAADMPCLARHGYALCLSYRLERAEAMALPWLAR